MREVPHSSIKYCIANFFFEEIGAIKFQFFSLTCLVYQTMRHESMVEMLKV